MVVDEYFEYETLQGDTFDMIALDFYDDEKYASLIIQANPLYCDVLIFDAGVQLKVPIIEEESASTLPPWKVNA